MARHDALAEEFGVSRTPVREALRVLHAQGVVEIVPHRGARVNGHSATDIRQPSAVRAELLGLAAGSAAEHIDDAKFEQLSRAVQGMQSAWQAYDSARSGGADGSDRQAMAALWTSSNAEFHSTVVEAAGNPQLTSTIVELQRRLPHNIYNRAYAGLRWLTCPVPPWWPSTPSTEGLSGGGVAGRSEYPLTSRGAAYG